MKYITFIVFLFCATRFANAALPYGPTDAELRTLPPYCKARMRVDTPREEKAIYERSLGAKNFLHIHHYCIATNFLQNRMYTVTNPKDRNHMLREIMANFKYVLLNAEKDFSMRPAINVTMGNVALQQKDVGTAIQHFSQAISDDPSFSPAYLPLIETYKKVGDKAAALATATAGLQQFPDMNKLQALYLELGGEKPFPDPIHRAESSSRGQNSDPENTVDGAASRESAEPLDQKDLDVASDSDSNVQLRTGCRFCPPQDIVEKWRGSFELPAPE